jgi:hypothetical protein
MSIVYATVQARTETTMSSGCLLPGQSQTGYGKKITTRHKVKRPEDKKWRRVYATCYSNCVSYWITVAGKKVHLHDTFTDLPLTIVERRE